MSSSHLNELKLGSMATLDEPVMDTLVRDLQMVIDKLKVVLVPLSQQGESLKKLREWDLWGPLLVCLLLCMVLSVTAPGDSASLVFAAVFVIVWCGAAIVTLNAQLLTGQKEIKMYFLHIAPVHHDTQSEITFSYS